MLANAVRHLRGQVRHLYLCDGEAFRAVALQTCRPHYADMRRARSVIRPDPGSRARPCRANQAGSAIADIADDRAYLEGDPAVRSRSLDLGGCAHPPHRADAQGQTS